VIYATELSIERAARYCDWGDRMQSSVDATTRAAADFGSARQIIQRVQAGCISFYRIDESKL